MRLKFLLVTWLLTTSMAVAQGTPAPILFFSDLILGANTGNSDTTYAAPPNSTGSGSTPRGVYVELYGNYLDNYSAITLNGVNCMTVVSAPAAYLWYERMIVLIGNGCSTGNFAITTPGGTWSGPMVSTTKEGRTYDFTVVSGHIYYVATGGSGTGTFSSPWGSSTTSMDSMADGDVTYFENGYTNSSSDGQGGVIDPNPDSGQCASSKTSQRAMVGYPGATVTIGNTSLGAQDVSIPAGDWSGNTPCNGYEIAEMTLLTGDAGTAVGIWTGGTTENVYNFRFVGLTMECPIPGAGAEAGCFGDGSVDTNVEVIGISLYGNTITNTGNVVSNTLYHAEYHSSDSIEEGWGYINPLLNNTSSTPGVCNDIQLYSSYPTNTYDIHIHDMWIYNSSCSGILESNGYSDAALSGFFTSGYEIYNNVFNNTGYSSGRAGISWDGLIGSVPAQTYNNTMYNVAAGGGGFGVGNAYVEDNCASSPYCGLLNMQNNIIYMANESGNSYITLGYGTVANQFTGTNNDFYGIGAFNSSTGSTSWIGSNSLNVNPEFVSTTSPYNFGLQSGSPMIGAGATTGIVPAYDINGLVRPSPPSIGAYEYAAGASSDPPNPPTGLAATVN